MIERLPSIARKIYSRFDLAVLIAAASLLVAMYVFVETVDEVTEGETDKVDRYIVHWVKGLDAPNWFNEFMRDCTAFGGSFVLSLTTLAICIYFYAKRLYSALGFLLLTVGGAFVLSMTLKWFFNRPRPDIIEHGSYTYTTSFPSGHAMLSAAVWLTIGVMLARLEKSHYLKAYFICLGLFISFLTGVSRVWLGVHWPTDVLAGWAGGTVWAVACWFLARYLQHRGKIERSSDDPVKKADAPGHEFPVV